jgi:hypothetical protein
MEWVHFCRFAVRAPVQEVYRLRSMVTAARESPNSAAFPSDS